MRVIVVGHSCTTTMCSRKGSRGTPNCSLHSLRSYNSNSPSLYARNIYSSEQLQFDFPTSYDVGGGGTVCLSCTTTFSHSVPFHSFSSVAFGVEWDFVRTYISWSRNRCKWGNLPPMRARNALPRCMWMIDIPPLAPPPLSCVSPSLY